MPDLPSGGILVGVLAALLVHALVNPRGGERRVPIWALALIAVAAAYVLPPVFAVIGNMWRSMGLPAVTSGVAFIGGTLGVLAYSLLPQTRFSKGRRLVLSAAIALGAGLAVPQIVLLATGSYSALSFRDPVSGCTSTMAQATPSRDVTNICDTAITVGLCLPDERNPVPCAQTQTLAPGEAARFDPQGTAVASMPANPNGFTIVACRPPARPSRDLRATSRGYRGVCLPPL